MRITKIKKAKPASDPAATLVIKRSKGESNNQAMARILLEPNVRHALTASAFAGQIMGGSETMPGIMDYAGHLESNAARAEGGDLGLASRVLTAQAITLDSMFTEFARRAGSNMSEHLLAAERYGRLALKAQSNCRSTLEALAKLHQPREQTVRHVHVNEGGQAVVADHFHHHAGGHENAKTAKQSHATGSAGAIPALPSPDPLGDAVPLAGRIRKAAVPHARRD